MYIQFDVRRRKKQQTTRHTESRLKERSDTAALPSLFMGEAFEECPVVSERLLSLPWHLFHGMQSRKGKKTGRNTKPSTAEWAGKGGEHTHGEGKGLMLHLHKEEAKVLTRPLMGRPTVGAQISGPRPIPQSRRRGRGWSIEEGQSRKN